MLIRRILFIWGMVCLVTWFGCRTEPPGGDASSRLPAAQEMPEEPSWEEQLAAVRSGASRRIQVTREWLTREQWNELIENCGELERLDLEQGDVDDEALSVLTSLPNLRHLRLGFEVGDTGIEHISQVTSLEFLNLPAGRFTNAGLERLQQLPRLRQLRFRSPLVTDDGLKMIPRMPELRYLHIISTPITDEGLRHLHGLEQLQSFYLDGCMISDEAVYELLRALPRLHFHRDQLHLPDDPLGHDHDHEATVKE